MPIIFHCTSRLASTTVDVRLCSASSSQVGYCQVKMCDLKNCAETTTTSTHTNTRDKKKSTEINIYCTRHNILGAYQQICIAHIWCKIFRVHKLFECVHESVWCVSIVDFYAFSLLLWTNMVESHLIARHFNEIKWKTKKILMFMESFIPLATYCIW